MVISRFQSFISKLPTCLLGEEINNIFDEWLRNVQLDHLDKRENHLTTCLRYVELTSSGFDYDIHEMSVDQINELYFLMLIGVVEFNDNFLNNLAFCHT